MNTSIIFNMKWTIHSNTDLYIYIYGNMLKHVKWHMTSVNICEWWTIFDCFGWIYCKEVIHVNELNFSTRSEFLLLMFKALLKYLNACICADCKIRDGCETGLLTWSLWANIKHWNLCKVYLHCQYYSVYCPALSQRFPLRTEILLWFFWSSEGFPMCCSISSFSILIKCLNCFPGVSESAEFGLAWVVNPIL